MARGALGIVTILLLCCCIYNRQEQPVPKGFVYIPKGTHHVGVEHSALNPKKTISLKPYYISATEITNEQFTAFVNATGYITDAEKYHHANVSYEGMKDWQWETDTTACWKYPMGKNKPGIADKSKHPVTLVSYNDALAYCKWAEGRLPSLAEWEVAARGDSKQKYPWGEEFVPGGRYMANTWNGKSHSKNSLEDSFLYTSPAGSFPPNSFGLYDVIGNVFEYCDPGKAMPDSNTVFARGGSWWCSFNTCHFFNLYDVGTINRFAAFSNHGFRMVKDVK